MKFIHELLELPKLERIHRDNVRYYKLPNSQEDKLFVSVTSVTSFYNRDFFKKWRQKVGEDEANRITAQATSKGTDTHSLIESYTLNEKLPKVQEASQKLFEIAKPALHRINKFYGIELGLYSKTLGIAGTVDAVADFDNELSIIDYKTSKYPKKREWIEHYFVQAMAYGMMLYEITGLKIKKLVIIMPCDDGKLAVYEERDLKKYMKLVVKYLKHYVKENTKYGN